MFRRRGSFKGIDSRGTRLAFGRYGLKSLGMCELTSRQLEAGRKAIVHFLKRGGRIWIRVFPDKAITKKAAEVPMGGGKGSIEYYAILVKPGRILFEVDGIGEEDAKKALTLAGYKLPIKTKFVQAS